MGGRGWNHLQDSLFTVEFSVTKETVLLMGSFIYVVLMFNYIMGLTGIDFSKWMDE